MKKLNGSTLLEALIATVIVVTVLSIAVLIMTNLNGSNLQEIKASATMRCEAWMQQTIEHKDFVEDEQDLGYGQMTRRVNLKLRQPDLVLVEIEFESPALTYPITISSLVYNELE